MAKRKLKIAVTGGIGSGKSEVCRFYESCGYQVLNADLLAKNLMSNNSVIREKLIKAFGKNIYTKSCLNKEFISELIFHDQKNLEKINSLVHPETAKKIDELAATELLLKDIVFVESALIFEAKREKNFDYILLITAPFERRIERLINRDKITKEDVLARINSQLDENVKKEKSHFVIENNLTIDELKDKAKFFLGIFENLIHKS